MSGNLLYAPPMYIFPTKSFFTFIIKANSAIDSKVQNEVPKNQHELFSHLHLNLLCNSQTDARFMQDGRKVVWSIPYVSVAFFPSLKQNFIAYRNSKMSDCIF